MRVRMINRLCLGILSASLIFLSSSEAFAQNASTPGNLTLSSTFEAVSVRASFSGDQNQNNSATIRFRRQGDTAWKNALPPIVDRRTSVAGRTNPYVRQARGSIVGLQAGTPYEVSLTFADPDGISGSATLTGTVDTIDPVAPLSGRELFVDDVTGNGNGSSASPFNSISAALGAAAAGDTIRLRPGTYPSFTISKSGTASGYIAIVGDSRDQVFINGSSGNNINVNGSYIQLKNLRMKQSSHSSIEVQSSMHHVWIENIYHENVSSSHTYDDAGISILDGTHNVYVLSNQIYSASLSNFAITGARWDSPGAGIYVAGRASSQGTFVLANNVIDGGFRDCIGNGGESWGDGTMDNSDIANNTITNCKDDGIQMEGDDVNLRIWGNDVTANNGYSALAQQSSLVGPVYVFRNVFRLTWAGGSGTAMKWGGAGFTFSLHNTIDSTGGGAHDGFAGDSNTMGQVVRNNIIVARANPLYCMGSGGGFELRLQSILSARRWHSGELLELRQQQQLFNHKRLHCSDRSGSSRAVRRSAFSR